MSNPQIPPGAGPSIGQLLQQAQRMQAELLTAQQELADARVDGTAGGGLVKATVTGGGELVDLVIDPAAVDPSDTETLADLVLAAVRDAADNARRRASERMGQVTGGLGDILGGFGGPGGIGGLGDVGGPGRAGGGPAGLPGGSGPGSIPPGLG
ncbi:MULTISPECIES: YbaB/EbfC family nucleoid-associated protein [Protofrankia]|uniref:Nucleoid-associated protein FsymDg_0592 n=1 Tax=Candidatus Protofrankia datiscae TaxID=2716812 RepID=F8AUS8_9ACTN|nr:MULTISPECIES: YbaB/EbfC family nucleoid-associated protein [Protofrankia]AEH08122.1 UPF0133 protein ybaB [Candidatus Protofrankia datiscae]